MNNTIYSKFREWVDSAPEARAVADESRSLSYGELDKLVDTIAARMPVKAPRRVGIVMDHSVEMIAAMLAVLKSGAAYVPVEPSMPEERTQFIMGECEVDFVITNSRYASRFSRVVMTVDQEIEIDHSADCPDRSRPDGVAYILYTSGSTGLPKGVTVTNANVCHYARAFHKEFHNGPGDLMLQYSVCTFDIFVEEVFTTLLNGAALAVAPLATRDDVELLMAFVEERGVTILSGFPYLLLDINKLGKVPRSLRLMISGGDVLRRSYVDKLLPQVEIYNTYGPSETTVCASYFRCNDAKAYPDGTFPIGHPVEGAAMEIRDENLQPVADGQVGEICILGNGVSLGYIGDRQVENRAFVTLADGRRLYRSGDLGIRHPDGTFRFLHRKDSQVMILGKRVETTEVENVLLQCPEVECGVVKAATDNLGLSFLTAYYVPRVHRRFSLAALKKKMARFLPPYMIPEFFVKLKEMPLTPNGKVDCRVLPIITKNSSL